MKLNKLTSAVSVSLLAVALTACGGSDDDAPIINNNASAPAPAPAPTPTPAPTPADNTANIAALTAAFKAAGLSDAKAAELAAANPTITAGSAEFNALVTAAKAPADTGTNNAVSETVVRQNHFIQGVDTTKNATVTANQYTRQPGSNFDRSANPSAQAGLGAIGTDDPTKQNPFLSNYVLGVEVVGGKVVAIDSTGELVERDGSNHSGKLVSATDSPYAKNDGLRYTASTNNGGKTFNYAGAGGGDAATANDFYDLKKANLIGDTTNVSGVNDVIAGQADTKATIYTIQNLNKNNVASNLSDDARDALAEAQAASPLKIQRNSTTGKAERIGSAGAVALQGLTSGLVVYNSGSVNVANTDGEKLGYKVPTYGVEENIYNEDGVVLNAPEARQKAETNKLNANRNLNGIFLSKEVTQYSASNPGDPATPRGAETYFKEQFIKVGDKQASNGTAITGQNDVVSNAPAAPIIDHGTEHLAKNVANSHETRIFGKNYNSWESGATGAQSTPNTYVARYDSKDRLTSAGVGVRVLNDVQYGRLTNNIDVLTDKDANSKKAIVYRQFQQHGADNSVDTYFYRGTHHTTLAEMEAIKAKGGTIQYYGHALTYGVGPVVEEKVAGTLPTAYGATSTEATIGNFVQAKYDVAKARVDGSVYNFINRNLTAQTNNNKDFKRQDLITFGGDVYGNTVTGTATKLGANEQGTFTGSFFGSAANELGGSISSITRSEGYSSPKWGAVFGATKGSSVENFNVIEQGN